MEFYLAEVVTSIPAHDPKRCRVLEIEECSRAALPQAIPAGTLARIRPFGGPGVWMAYFRSGIVLKMTAHACRAHLMTLRGADGQAMVDRTGVGAELAEAQNERGQGKARARGA